MAVDDDSIKHNACGELHSYWYGISEHGEVGKKTTTWTEVEVVPRPFNHLLWSYSWLRPLIEIWCDRSISSGYLEMFLLGAPGSVMDIKFPFSSVSIVFSSSIGKDFFLPILEYLPSLNIISYSSIFSVCYGIKVRNLTVPQSYVLDRNTVAGQKPITLDCEYETDGNDTGVVLKWFFNNNPIYQWIPGSNPIPLQRFKPHLSTTFAVNHPKQMYRALHISNPTWNMTGKYTCSLQSFQSSDRETAQMIVIGKLLEVA